MPIAGVVEARLLTMESRVLGSTGLTVSRMGIGWPH
jgi:hypothetical protein